MADDDLRELERRAQDDPQARVALEVERERLEEPEADPGPTVVPQGVHSGRVAGDHSDRPRTVVIPVPAVGARPAKWPLFLRGVLPAGQSSVDLAQPAQAVHGGVSRNVNEFTFFWYGFTLFPTVTGESRQAVLDLWRKGSLSFRFSPTRNHLVAPLQTCMPHPLLLSSDGADIEAVRASMGAMDQIARRILLASTMGRPASDVTVMGRPIELEPHGEVHFEVSGPPPDVDVELLLVLYGIRLVPGVVS